MRNVIGMLAALALTLLQSAPSVAQYQNFDECAKAEVALIEKLVAVRSQGGNVRQYLEAALGSKLSVDAEYLLWLFETRPARLLAQALIGKCALAHPDSSPFSKHDLAKLREAQEQAMRRMILQREGRIPDAKK